MEQLYEVATSVLLSEWWVRHCLQAVARQGLGWDITTLYTFTGEDDGTLPYGRVIAGPYGSRYGIATNGTVFGVRGRSYHFQSPPCAWTESVLYVIGGDGGDMSAGDLTCDQAGNIYGTSAATAMFTN